MSTERELGHLPDFVFEVHRIANLIAGEAREEAANAGIIIESGQGVAPASREWIDALPVGVVSDSECTNCVICLEEAITGSEVTNMPCGHEFHPDCLSGWLMIRGSCPVCRRVIGECGTEAGDEERQHR